LQCDATSRMPRKRNERINGQNFTPEPERQTTVPLRMPRCQ
jgi:hypothetical protein